jgi:hypothetical protein
MEPDELKQALAARSLKFQASLEHEQRPLTGTIVAAILGAGAFLIAGSAAIVWLLNTLKH